MGRDPSNAIVIHSAAVSRQHALLLRLLHKDGQYTYRLLDGNLEGKRSTNGISVNGQRCLSWDLKDGDPVGGSGAAAILCSPLLRCRFSAVSPGCGLPQR
ncbi:FHA domain-containing protein [Synechococcus sp. H70.2]|uniref:FHA domain-containing protein n=1 Tax=Synechococcus sp. H70.2 TaxID=2964528 RepID=UPI0039C04770